MKISEERLSKINRLVSALQAANRAAELFKDHPDGGTINSDRVTIELKSWRSGDISIASEMSGVKIGGKMGSSLWRNARVVHFTTHGQASRNTKQCEKACEILTERGFIAFMFYQMN